MGYSEAKKRLSEQFEEKFGPTSERREALEKDEAYVQGVLAAGGN